MNSNHDGIINVYHIKGAEGNFIVVLGILWLIVIRQDEGNLVGSDTNAASISSPLEEALHSLLLLGAARLNVSEGGLHSRSVLCA